MKILFVLLVNFFEANPCADVIHITPKNPFLGKETSNIMQGSPLIEQQDPIIVLSEEQWLSLSEKIMCPQPLIQKKYLFTTHQFGSFDHQPGHYMVAQLSGFVQ